MLYRENDKTDNRIKSYSQLQQTLELLMYPVLDEQVDYFKYDKIVTEYLENVLQNDVEHAIEQSAKYLMKIGY